MPFFRPIMKTGLVRFRQKPDQSHKLFCRRQTRITRRITRHDLDLVKMTHLHRKPQRFQTPEDAWLPVSGHTCYLKAGQP